ncbi:MAG: energy-coupling factor transporter transmembrane protein EcfT [Oscillospiraceae bacterium]|nr:energy-coupling factor transporter transmembrane protein EcfT [Oscillospiraceae bacterium]MBR2897881.1 energy-coupling factor transporter transmembrane protein EcfT [Oscillospiraceae bacterium]MBR2977201.1 energy-coupling factor transporter transmembrane protein EcfT [Oscillospiraceae bacterium]
MMRDFTLGQYFPGNSILHRLDPRTKLLATVIYIVALFLAKWYISYGIMLAFLLLCIGLSRVAPGTILRSMKPLLFVILLTGILNMFYTTGDPLVSFWIFTITKQGLQNAGFMVLRIAMLVVGTFLLTYTTSPMDLTDGMERLLRPLSKLRFPVHELSMMMSIALRFIPTLATETDKIISAQKARGADFESGSLIRRAKALIPILVPLFIGAFRRADELATAMECRCYCGGAGRTKLRVLRWEGRDLAAGLALLLLLGAVIALRCFGF